MARKRAQFFTWGKDSQCTELIKFIEESGILLDIRDIEKLPLTEEELAKVIGHCDIYHFLNPMSKSYDEHELDKKNKKREDILKLMAADYTLVRQPIIRTSRLMTIGCDRKTINEVLSVGSEGVRVPDEMERVKVKHNKKNGKSQKSSRVSVAPGR